MGKADSMSRKLDKLLTRFNAVDRPAYKRLYTRTGGDALLGDSQTVTKTDTLLSPQPALTTMSDKETLALVGTTVVQTSDVMMIVSSSALSSAEIKNPNLAIVMKNGASEEEYIIAAYVPSVLEGKTLVFNVLLKSKSRTG